MMKNIISLIRPHHWTKNGFVFMPLFFGHELLNIELLLNTMVMFLAFSLAASSIYCFNDIIDVEDDRRHPVKCHRPIAAGKVSVIMGYSLMMLLVMCAIVLSYFANIQDCWSCIMVISLYWFIEIAYCTRLKRIAIVDVCILSLGFVLRIFAGGVATGIVISNWLVMMTFLLTLFLGFAKRRDDVLKMDNTGIAPRHNTKRYNLTFVNVSLTVTASVTLVCYIMYTVSSEVTRNFNTNHLYLTSIFVIIGLLRYMQLAVVDNKTGDPTKVLLKDRFTQLIILGWWIAFFVVIYI